MVKPWRIAPSAFGRTLGARPGPGFRLKRSDGLAARTPGVGELRWAVIGSVTGPIGMPCRVPAIRM